MNPPGASPQLTQFLSLFRVHKGHEFTHTSLGRPGGSFYIPSSSYEAFMGAYCAAVERGEDLFMTERHRHIGPAVVDLDFRFAADQQQQQQQQPVRLYTRETVKQIVRVISRAIGALVDLPEFECYVTEKPSPTLCKNLVKDGLHLAFPAVVTRPEVQHVLRSDILDPMARMLKEELPELVNSVEDIIDDAVIERNNWMMYGSKKPSCEPYVVTVRYRYTTETDALEEVPSDVTAATPATEYIQALSIRNKYDDVQVRSDHRERVECFIARREEEQRRREVIAGVMATSPNPTTNVCDSLEDCISFVSILNKDRASNYDDWVRLGWCLRNIDHRLLDTWDSFSRQSPKYIEGECPRLWNAMRAGGLGIGTLHMWARHDSPSQYMELLRAGLRGLLEDSAETATHYDVAQVVHHLYRYQYACCNIRNRTWYEFKDHRWRECESGYTLRARLSTDVFQEYRDLHKRLEDNLEVLAREVRGSREERMNSSSTSDGADRGNDDDMQRLKDRVRAMERRIKKTSDLGLKLKISAFKDNVLKECAELFYHEKFENKLNSNVDLLGFENGVLDLQRLEFREGRPDDYISFSTGINHIPYCPDHPIVKDIMHYWECVHTDPAMRKYVLTTIASCLSGRIREERFHIWTGSGCHAAGTGIRLYDGGVKLVENVQMGDVLMGDDNTPRNVLRLCRGHSDMWKIVPVKGDPFTVNGEHVLSLVATKMHGVTFRGAYRPNLPFMAKWFERSIERVVEVKAKAFKTESEAVEHIGIMAKTNERFIAEGSVIDVKVCDYLANVKRFGARNFYLYRPDVIEFPERSINPDLHPYVLGAWLGDGTSSGTQITSMDDDIIDRVKECLPSNMAVTICKQKKGLASTYNLSSHPESRLPENRRNRHNPLRTAMNGYGLLGKDTKHIPDDYLYNTRDVRMQVLAGLLDTDGAYQEHTNQLTITQKNERLMDNIVCLARSLGFACYKKCIQSRCCNNGVVGTYYTTNIVGDGIQDIPLALERKRPRDRVKRKDVHRVGFKIERVEDDDFYGFELDGNHRYLMEDYIVTHNSNSKSLSVSLLEKSLGDYCCKFPVTLMTQKRAASGAATPEIARAKGRRFAVLQEPSEDERLNVGQLKELSGGDVVQTRELFKAPCEWKPQFKLFLLCNTLPHVPSDDGGTWRRIRVVEFGSKFTENPNPDNPREFPVDLDLTSKLDSWREHFMAILIQYYKAYMSSTLCEPEPVLACTREYQRTNDHLADFVDSCIERVSGSEEDAGTVSLAIDDAFSEYKEWARNENIPAMQQRITKTTLLKYLTRYLGKPNAHSSGARTKKGDPSAWKGARIYSNAPTMNASLDAV